jgi:hypothetical protein
VIFGLSPSGRGIPAARVAPAGEQFVHSEGGERSGGNGAHSLWRVGRAESSEPAAPRVLDEPISLLVDDL